MNGEAQGEAFVTALLAAQRSAARRRKRGHYYWKWTPQKERAARLAARGLSISAIARATPANRRSVSRWLQRPQFVERLEHHRWFGIAGAQVRRELKDVERRIVGVDRAVGRAVDSGDDAAIISALRVRRGAIKRQRSTERRLGIRAPRI